MQNDHDRDNGASEASLHAFDYWQVLKNRYGVILLTFLLIFMTAAVITYVLPKKYESTVVLQVLPSTPDLDPFGGQLGASVAGNQMTRQFFATEFEVIAAEKTLMRVVERLDLTSRWKTDSDSVVQILRGIIATDQIRGTDLIEIRVRHTVATDARDIAEKVAEAYQARRTDEEMTRASTALDALNEELRDQEDLVEEKRKVLDTIVQAIGIPYVEGVRGAGEGRSQEVLYELSERQLYEMQAERDQLENQIKTLTKLESEELMKYAAGLNLPQNGVTGLFVEFQESERELINLQASGLGDKHPDVAMRRLNNEGLKRDLEKAVTSLREILKTQMELVDGRLSNMRETRNQQRDNAVDRALESHDYVEAKREYENAQGMLQAMKLQHSSKRIGLRIPKVPITMHQEATTGRSPVSPKVTLYLSLGAIVGLIFGITIAFFLEYLDTSVKSLEDVEGFLQVPVLAVIPKDVGILHKQSGMSPDAEAYRILRTNIEFNRKNPEDNAITIVSGGAGEGKSTTLVNLAYVCAQGGYTTLMVDADLRRPRLHTFFDINNSVGLTNYLTTDLMLEDVILQTPVDNLYFLPSGILPADAAGILNSRRMSELIQDVKQRFDLILIDSPPILGVSDASVLASEVDLTMIVVQHRKLPRNMLLRVKQAVENVGGHVIGVVLNNVDVRSDSQYQYYTSYYTYYAPSADNDPVPSAASLGKGASSGKVAATGKSSSTDDEDTLY
ncbi:MAG: polysaccharide biosynthesis tyrosine autokinase [Verrucomicrobia bacterium]|nr:polysaccharide biosynthesis tyrosine autokinase [Verrucomicrobiota bacterium]